MSELLAERRRESVDLWGRTINPQFSRVLKKIGFDREWARAEGAPPQLMSPTTAT